MRPKNLFLIVFAILFVCHFGYAQEDFVRVKTRALPPRVTLGDEIRLILQMEEPANYKWVPPSLKTKLSPFEIKDINIHEKTTWLLLTTFQLGELTIPPIQLEVRDPAGNTRDVFTKAQNVQVVSVGKRPTDKDDIRPIQGPVSLDVSFVRVFIFLVLAVSLVIFLATKIILRRRKAKIDPETLLPAHERACLELERLKNRGWLSEGKAKEFYSELADILRRYLERRFGVEAFERTSFEILSDLRARNFGQALLGEAKEVLENSDLVKFAKFTPPASLADTLEEKIRNFVIETKPEEVTDKK